MCVFTYSIINISYNFSVIKFIRRTFFKEITKIKLGSRILLVSISPIQRPHYITSSYTYQFLKKILDRFRIQDC